MDKIWYNHIRYQIKAIRNKLGVSDAEVDKLEKEEDKKYPGAENTRDKEMDEIFNQYEDDQIINNDISI